MAESPASAELRAALQLPLSDDEYASLSRREKQQYGHAEYALARLRAHDAGRAAALAGESIETCPHADGTPEARSWRRAWRQATDA